MCPARCAKGPPAKHRKDPTTSWSDESPPAPCRGRRSFEVPAGVSTASTPASAVSDENATASTDARPEAAIWTFEGRGADKEERRSIDANGLVWVVLECALTWLLPSTAVMVAQCPGGVEPEGEVAAAPSTTEYNAVDCPSLAQGLDACAATPGSHVF